MSRDFDESCEKKRKMAKIPEKVTFFIVHFILSIVSLPTMSAEVQRDSFIGPELWRRPGPLSASAAAGSFKKKVDFPAIR